MTICTTCNEHFNGVESFDAHRQGRYIQGLKPGQQPLRHCLTPRQMIEQGMTKNERDAWTIRKTRYVASGFDQDGVVIMEEVEVAETQPFMPIELMEMVINLTTSWAEQNLESKEV